MTKTPNNKRWCKRELRRQVRRIMKRTDFASYGTTRLYHLHYCDGSSGGVGLSDYRYAIRDAAYNMAASLEDLDAPTK